MKTLTWLLLLLWSLCPPKVDGFERSPPGDHFGVLGGNHGLVMVVEQPRSGSRRRIKRQAAGSSASLSGSNASDDGYGDASDLMEDVAGWQGRRKKYHRLAHSVTVKSDIRYRYANTLIMSKVTNEEPVAREVFQSLILPETAFISRFAIEVDGQVFVAHVKEKENAWREYQEAVTRGQTAGHVGVSARHSNHFRVSVNTKSGSTVTFFLLYEELLQRKGGLYEHLINLTPRLRLKDFSIDVSIAENRKISVVQVPPLRSHDPGEKSGQPGAAGLDTGITVNRPDENKVLVLYRPDLRKLQNMLEGNHTIKFSVLYDVDRPSSGQSEVEVVDGYFVHFVAPPDLAALPKHVIFTLDLSGSMARKLQQTKEAMKTILSQLTVDLDAFTIILFNADVWSWGTQEATKPNLERAKDRIDSLEVEGETNIHEALMKSLVAAADRDSAADRRQPFIVFLTDGEPTKGITDPVEILAKVRKANAEGSDCAIFGLAFGRSADFNFLRTLSIQNHAFARRIYAAADAALQLQSFYSEVSSPLLTNVTFRYQGDGTSLPDSLTSTNFHTYYKGGEMVVAGRIPEVASFMDYEIVALQGDEPYRVKGRHRNTQHNPVEQLPQTITEVVNDLMPAGKDADPRHKINYLERLWAYLTIQELLKRVARGEIYSCSPESNRTEEVDRIRRSIEGPGVLARVDIAEVMEEVGDYDILICNNLERALFLSLKYEFVTPLTSLVVVKPDVSEEGSLSEAGGAMNRRNSFHSQASSLKCSTIYLYILFLILLKML